MGASLYDKESDDAFFNYLRVHLPKTIDIVERTEYVEEHSFVEAAVDHLIELIES